MELALGFFAVANALARGEEQPRGSAPAVYQELALIRDARGLARSPLFGYTMDYSQFRSGGIHAAASERASSHRRDTDVLLKSPDGPASLERYFRLMVWYGAAGFRLESDRETGAALLITRAFARSRRSAAWRRLDRAYTALFGPCNDLTPQAAPGSVYLETLRLLETLISPADEHAPAFARTAAYRDRSRLTALAAWTMARHTAMLVTAPQMNIGCVVEEPALCGYVEPNPAFFSQLRRLCQAATDAGWRQRFSADTGDPIFTGGYLRSGCALRAPLT